MNMENFMNWMTNEKGLKENTAKSTMSRVVRIQKGYDLDREYEADGLEGVMATFEKAITDAKEGLVPNINIAIGGDYITGLGSLKGALFLYKEYKTSGAMSENKNECRAAEIEEEKLLELTHNNDIAADEEDVYEYYDESDDYENNTSNFPVNNALKQVLQSIQQNEEKRKQQQSRALAQYISTNFTEGVQFAIAVAGVNCEEGSFWGFSDVRTLRRKIEEINQEAGIQVKKIKDEECIIEIEPEKMLDILCATNPNLFSDKYIDGIRQMKQEAETDFIRYMLANGKKSVDKMNNTIGIYCTEYVTNIRHEEHIYPVFRINLEKALAYMDQYQYGLIINNRVITACQAINMGSELYKELTLSPEKTSVFIQVKPFQNSIFYAELEKQQKDTNMY